MRNIPLYEAGGHRFILLNESEPGEEEGIRSNQYLVMHGESGVLLDPGGFGVMPGVLGELMQHMAPENIAAIILSHQDPDIVGGLSTWLELTSAAVHVSRIWLRFLPHYGLRDMDRFAGIPDEGATIEPAPGLELQLVPAHFLHSAGHFNVFDPRSRVLFSGDVGAGLMPDDQDDPFVRDFDAHLPHIEGFHKRYMAGNRATRDWADRVAELDVAMIAPQHGPVYAGEAVPRFLDWMRNLACGIDLLGRDGGS